MTDTPKDRTIGSELPILSQTPSEEITSKPCQHNGLTGEMAAMEITPAPQDQTTDVEWKAQVDQARVSGFAEGIERAAKIADEQAAHFEKQAATASSDSRHDALLLAADGCELTADAIREVMGGSTE